MSSFLGVNSNSAGPRIGTGADDRRLWQDPLIGPATYQYISIVEPFHHLGFQTDWWPARGRFDSSGDEYLSANFQWGRPVLNSGAVSKMAFTGVTRDAYGSILGSCTVKLFKTTSGAYANTKDLLLDETTSDPTTGAFTLYTPYHPDTHYIVSYKTGSPDVEGTTVNTLIGA